MTTIRVATFAGPGAPPVIREVPRPAVPRKAALIQIGACGVCGTDLHILKGHWPKPLPWPFTLGHELAGVIVEIGAELTRDWTGQELAVGSKVMLPPLMPCGSCYWCTHFPETANKCPTPVYDGRYLGFERPPHLWGGFAEMVYVDLEQLPGTKVYKLPDDMPLRLVTSALPSARLACGGRGELIPIASASAITASRPTASCSRTAAELSDCANAVRRSVGPR